ncbi:MAG: class I SAM-dependent methyltransferase [Candidatus Shapirobacteria bacterium]|nr:class I SAM-dependent methyltransferase [Candidatus Shapirobacteria bacterium]
MLDVVLRYIPLVRAVKKLNIKNKTIVEIGGSGEGIGFYLPNYKIIDCDISFVKNILPNVKPLINKNSTLPLPSNYSDIVVSTDMLEHLPTNHQRENMIKEMIRVAKKEVVLGVPVGSDSLNAIKIFGVWFKKRWPKLKNQYVTEHIKFGQPSEKDILQMIKNSNYKAKVLIQKNTNIKLWLLFQKFYLKFPKLYLIFRYRRFWYFILGPFYFLFNHGKTMRNIFLINLDKN